MTTAEKIDYKMNIRQACIDILKGRLTTIEQAMENAQKAANEEEKSSAGDKYETSRAMSHLEKDMHAKQLVATRNELEELLSIDCSGEYKLARAGSIVTCEKAIFFIVAGIGKITVNDEVIYVLSPAAPMARILAGKKPGDKFQFGKNEEFIVSIF